MLSTWQIKWWMCSNLNYPDKRVSIYASVIADHLDHNFVSLTVIMFVTIRVVCPTCIGFYDSVPQLATQASSLTDHILRKRVCIFGVANKIFSLLRLAPRHQSKTKGDSKLRF
ncbi:hypothetical protein Plhal304r1_c080g0166261 [Plasmopara halstedii]